MVGVKCCPPHPALATSIPCPQYPRFPGLTATDRSTYALVLSRHKARDIRTELLTVIDRLRIVQARLMDRVYDRMLSWRSFRVGFAKG